ncbi:MAG TPA: hypothetical protein VG604_02145, partial [Candidatus Saccharimonadales bacterium]|nr:hypothetical protein [Candidatus Saccharimonadales bacterium]
MIETQHPNETVPHIVGGRIGRVATTQLPGKRNLSGEVAPMQGTANQDDMRAINQVRRNRQPRRRVNRPIAFGLAATAAAVAYVATHSGHEYSQSELAH